MMRFAHLSLVFIVIIITSCNFLSPQEESMSNKPMVVEIKNDLIIDSNDTLIIEPGMHYVFMDTFRIIVRGRLIIKGEKNNPAKFSPSDSLNGSGTIVFENPVAESSIENAVFHNVRIYGEKVDLSIKACEFHNNLPLSNFDAVVRVFEGSIKISDCYVKGNHSGEGFLIHRIIDNPAIVENCSFDGVSDAIEFLAVKRQGKILNNIIYNINQVSGDGIDFNGCDSILIEGNTFDNIRDFGCEIGNDKYGPSRNIFIRNNVFANCYRGIVVKGGSEVFAEGNIFYKNKIAVKCQIETWSKVTDANTLIVKNSIFNKSIKLDYLNNENSSLEIINSCSDKSLEGVNNSIGNPQFRNPENLDFSMTENSDCLEIYESVKIKMQ